MRCSLFILTVLVVLAVQCAESVSNDHSQCQSHGYLGACQTGAWINMKTICQKLRCATATKIGGLHVSKSIGPAAVGTICGVSQACNAKHQCVPILNVPHQVGPTGSYRCKPEKV